MRARFLNVNGLRTRYLAAGEGRPVVLLHGIGLSADCFIRNLEDLGKRFAVFAPDLLGHGFTAPADFGNRPSQVLMAEHIHKLTRELGLSKYAVVGSSFGAHVAAHLYLQRPQDVTGLVLVGSGSVFHSNEEQKKTLSGSMANGRTAMIEPTLEKCRNRLVKIVCDPACIPPELPFLQLTSYALPDRLPAYEAAIQSSIAWMDDAGARVLSRLEQIDCPTLVIVGRDDIRADWRVHQDEVRRMPRAELLVYERCGHLPFLEHSERFNMDVVNFLSQDDNSILHKRGTH